MKTAVCIFHKDINRYPTHWIDKCIETLKNQTYNDFKVYEINYGSDNTRLWDDNKAEFFHQPLPNHVQAQNLIFDIAFDEGADYIFNVNIDDYYALHRIESQIHYLQQGFDAVSSYFAHIKDDTNIITLKPNTKDIAQQFDLGNNVIAHPVIAITRGFWQRNRYYLESDYETARNEDFMMWKRALAKNEKFCIIPETLLFHRLHPAQVGKIEDKSNKMAQITTISQSEQLIIYVAELFKTDNKDERKKIAKKINDITTIFAAEK